MDALDHTLLEFLQEIHSQHPIEGVVTGQSMFPALKNGQRIRLEPFQKDSCSVGDVVAYRLNGQFVIHRVVGKKKAEQKTIYFLKGDANLLCDPPVAEEEIIAKAILEKRCFSHLLARLSLWEARGYSLLKRRRHFLPQRIPFSKILEPLRPSRLLEKINH